MGTFDIAVLLFFVAIIYKVISDTNAYYRSIDEESASISRRRAFRANLALSKNHVQSRAYINSAPKHLPAPLRKSPTSLPIPSGCEIRPLKHYSAKATSRSRDNATKVS